MNEQWQRIKKGLIPELLWILNQWEVVANWGKREGRLRVTPGFCDMDGNTTAHLLSE